MNLSLSARTERTDQEQPDQELHAYSTDLMHTSPTVPAADSDQTGSAWGGQTAEVTVYPGDVDGETLEILREL